MIPWHNDNRDLGLLHLIHPAESGQGNLNLYRDGFQSVIRGTDVKGEATRTCRDTAGHGRWRNLWTSRGGSLLRLKREQSRYAAAGRIAALLLRFCSPCPNDVEKNASMYLLRSEVYSRGETRVPTSLTRTG